MILDIRGTHGSGKSWIVHQLLRGHAHRTEFDVDLPVGYYIQKLDVGVVGNYNNACGGCDGVKSADEVVRRVRYLHRQYRHVVLEGILVAHTFGRYSALARELGDYTFCFLNTPLNTCIGRVRARRYQKGNTKPFDPAHLISDWYNIWRKVRAKCLAAGHRVVVLDHRNPLPAVLELLR